MAHIEAGRQLLPGDAQPPCQTRRDGQQSGAGREPAGRPGQPVGRAVHSIQLRAPADDLAQRVADGRVRRRQLAHVALQSVGIRVDDERPAVTSLDVQERVVIDDLAAALYASRICAYAQGMALIRAGSHAYRWSIDLAEIGRIWKGGCIIRARLLDPVRHAFGSTPDLANGRLEPKSRPRNGLGTRRNPDKVPL